jgi:hypothetical protein
MSDILTGGSAGATTTATCEHCGAEVPFGAFCGNCGASLTHPGAPGRSSSYAAAPHEPVALSSVITTLFPHLPHRQVHVFREVLIAGVGVVLLLAAFRLVAPATLVSVLLLPVLYLLYLYESDVYEDEPVRVLLLTVISGGALGFLFFVIANRLSTPLISGTVQGPLVSGVVLPVIAQALMLAGPAVLLTRAKFDETLDGLAFGAAAALGFTLVNVIAGSWSFFTAPLVHGIATDDVLRILRSGVVASVVNAGTTGVITAAIWRRAPGHLGRPAWVTPLGITTGFGVQVVLGVAGYDAPNPLFILVIWTAVGAALLVAVRVVLHTALLEEAGEHLAGPSAPCSECHHLVPTMAFCPNCGAARLAAPKHTRPAGSPS